MIYTEAQTFDEALTYIYDMNKKRPTWIGKRRVGNVNKEVEKELGPKPPQAPITLPRVAWMERKFD